MRFANNLLSMRKKIDKKIVKDFNFCYSIYYVKNIY